jgi:hypothetical protein
VGPALGWGPVQMGGRNPGGRGSGSMAEGQGSWRGVCPVLDWRPVRLRGWYPSGVWIQRSLRGWDPTAGGSSARLWPGAARGAESPAEQSSSSAVLRGRDLAGGCSFIRSWSGEDFIDLRV